jgi:putative hydrolase of the HAD superfamily
MQEFKAIVFDLGGVLLNIDYHRTEQAFIALGVRQFPELYNQHHSGTLFTDLETGKIDTATFIEAVKKESSLPLNDQQILDAWNAMLLDFPLERISLLQRLARKYDLYLLSNTNAIHLEAFTKLLQVTANLPSLEHLFRKVYYSHLIGARKPDLAAYEYVIRENNLEAARTLFIDDTPGNIEGAAKAGLQAVLLKPPVTIIELLMDVRP